MIDPTSRSTGRHLPEVGPCPREAAPSRWSRLRPGPLRSPLSPRGTVPAARTRRSTVPTATVDSPFRSRPPLPTPVDEREFLASILPTLSVSASEVDSSVVPATVTLNHRLTASPALPGGMASIHLDPAETIAEMTRAVDEAVGSVHLSASRMSRCPFTEGFIQSLAAASGRGVRVLVLSDELSDRRPPEGPSLLEFLHARGVRRGAAANDPRQEDPGAEGGGWNHRRFLVVDGRCAFLGSMDLTAPFDNAPGVAVAGPHWVDLVGRFDGGMAAAIDAVFCAAWRASTGEDLLGGEDVPSGLQELRSRTDRHVDLAEMTQLVPSGPGYHSYPGLRTITSLIHGARYSVRIITPYFAPDESLFAAVTGAALSGLTVELTVSEAADRFRAGERSLVLYRELLRSGVRILEYPCPWILHSTCVLIDEEIAVFGSSAIDVRALVLDREITVLTSDPRSVTMLREATDHYRTRSVELGSAGPSAPGRRE